jgi:hypothetical protein
LTDVSEVWTSSIIIALIMETVDISETSVNFMGYNIEEWLQSVECEVGLQHMGDRNYQWCRETNA